MKIFSLIRRKKWIITGRWDIKRQIYHSFNKGNLKIIIGSGDTRFDGWISTDLPHFNILKPSHWDYFFSGQKIDNILAEHVIGHLVENEVNNVLKSAYKYLKRGGIFRVAVPDAFHPNPEYINKTRPPYDGHKSFWNYLLLSDLAKRNKFEVHLLEYYNENKKFTKNSFNNKDGYITRNMLNEFKEGFTPDYTSLIVDLIK